MIEVRSGVRGAKVAAAVLFAFDQESIPFSAGLRLELVSGKSPGRSNPVVLDKGPPGAPDDARVRFYGTVIPVGDELRMWYLARGRLDDGGPDKGLRACYALSRDGVHWERPNLGLVEYGGSRQNNIADLAGGRCVLSALPVIRDAQDLDPARLYKATFESGLYGNRLAVAFSADGLRWTLPPHNPVGEPMEQTGLIRFDGCYYVNGQDEFGWHGTHFGRARKLVTFASYDFETWTRASCLGFRRDDLPPRQAMHDWNTAEEVHLGAGLWDRGHVIVGVYDMWHGTPTGDRAQITMDLGLVVSHDALHYREPVPDFRLVPAAEELDVPPGRAPALSHGQGMSNLGDQTLLWYEVWGAGGVRLATWPRDRLGCLRAFHIEEELFARPEPHCITCPLRAEGAARVYANLEGASAHSFAKVEVLDERFRPLPGYSADAALPLREGGLRRPVVWRDRERIEGGTDFRLKVTFAGLRPEDLKLYALYVEDASGSPADRA